MAAAGVASCIIFDFDAVWSTRDLGVRTLVARDIAPGLVRQEYTGTTMVAVLGFHERGYKFLKLIDAIVNVRLRLFLRWARRISAVAA